MYFFCNFLLVNINGSPKYSLNPLKYHETTQTVETYLNQKLVTNLEKEENTET